MSVLMALRVSGDATGLEKVDPAVFKSVVAKAVEMGATKHRFFTNGSEILVLDEWPDRETFQKFFESTPEVPEVMAAAGVTEQPVIEFWDRVGVDDALNWD
ncbi:hypothetical protein [Marmoricola sp. RAF53]|uniref:hypothetical protein n=1 Tax=Marmoricola sp. RAF53 TaxID=3233059 RepID=UPI003F9B40EA